MIAISVIVIVVVLATVKAYYSSPKQKGKRGELRIQKILSQLPENDYTTFNDVVLKTAHGTTQIDHVVVSRYGVFVIETKNYRGEIYGNDDRQEWKQIIKTDVTFRKKLWKTYIMKYIAPEDGALPSTATARRVEGWEIKAVKREIKAVKKGS